MCFDCQYQVKICLAMSLKELGLAVILLKNSLDLGIYIKQKTLSITYANIVAVKLYIFLVKVMTKQIPTPSKHHQNALVKDRPKGNFTNFLLYPNSTTLIIIINLKVNVACLIKKNYVRLDNCNNL